MDNLDKYEGHILRIAGLSSFELTIHKFFEFKIDNCKVS